MPGITGPKPSVAPPSSPAVDSSSPAPAGGAGDAAAPAGQPVDVPQGPSVPIDGMDAAASDVAAASHVVGAPAGSSAAPAAAAPGGMPGAGNAFATRLAMMSGATGASAAGASGELAGFQAALAKGEVPTHFPIAALNDLPIPSSGLVLQLDSDTVAGQRVVLRRVVHPEHGEGVEMRLKLRHPEDTQRVVEKMEASGAKRGEWSSVAKTLDDQGRYVLDIDAKAAPYTNAATATHASARGDKPAEACLLEEDGRYEVRVLPEDAAQAVSGLVSIRAYFGQRESTVSRRMQAALEAAGLEETAQDSTPQSRELYNQLRVLWQSDPEAAQEFADVSLDSRQARKDVTEALKKAGVDADQAANMPTREVFPGHFTTMNPGQGDKYRDMGVQYLFSGVRKAEQVVAILEGDGLMSTRERYARGMLIEGASSAADLASGGADYVFTRMVTDAAKNKTFSSSFASGSYQLVYNTDVLDRTDWFAYTKDTFGSTRDLDKFTAREYGQELVDSMATGGFSGYATSNEVMFQTGLPNRDIQGIFASTEDGKKALIEALEAKGITELNGKPLTEAIEVRKYMVEPDGADS